METIKKIAGYDVKIIQHVSVSGLKYHIIEVYTESSGLTIFGDQQSYPNELFIEIISGEVTDKIILKLMVKNNLDINPRIPKKQISKTSAFYNESLSSKKWQKRRLRILNRDGNKCTACGSTERLVVHHQYYWSNKIAAAYEYPDSCLITLCNSCHYKYHSTCEVPKRKYNKPKPKRKLK